jgi:hypothetical protein
MNPRPMADASSAVNISMAVTDPVTLGTNAVTVGRRDENAMKSTT